MEKSQTSLDIRNPGLQILLLEVERYFVRGGSLSITAVYQPRKISINIV